MIPAKATTLVMLLIGISSVSKAADTCSMPSTPVFPVSLTDTTHAETVLASVLAHGDAIESFRKCLVDYANEVGGANLPVDELEDLKDRYAAADLERRSVAETWNAIYGPFLANGNS